MTLILAALQKPDSAQGYASAAHEANKMGELILTTKQQCGDALKMPHAKVQIGLSLKVGVRTGHMQNSGLLAQQSTRKFRSQTESTQA